MNDSALRFWVNITSLGMKAEGIARHDGKVLFVPFALPGEHVLVEVQKDSKQYAICRTIYIRNLSQNRTTPVCPYYTACGGCACQHMSYQTQLNLKENMVQNAFKSAANITLTTNKTIGISNPWHYRNKTTWAVNRIESKPQVGFFSIGKQSFIPVEHCYIASKECNKAVSLLKLWMMENGAVTCDEQNKTDIIKRVVTRTNSLGKMMVTLVSNSMIELHKIKDYANILKETLRSSFHSLNVSVINNETDQIRGNHYEVIEGPSHLHESIGNLEFRLSPQSFFQINHQIADALYRHVIHQCEISKNDVVLDIYCGIGTLTLLAAKECKYSFGIECSPQSIQDARHNAIINQIQNVQFWEGKAEKIVPVLIKQGVQPDVIILDPPRKGIEIPVIEAIGNANPRTIVYVSCNPATQARDISRLLVFGYEITYAQPFDMFCQTAEVEIVVTLRRIKHA